MINNQEAKFTIRIVFNIYGEVVLRKLNHRHYAAKLGNLTFNFCKNI